MCLHHYGELLLSSPACSVENCDNPASPSAGPPGLCPLHFAQLQLAQASDAVPGFAAKICTEPGCSRKHYARGLCNSHYQSQRKQGFPLDGSGPLPADGRRHREPAKNTCAVCGTKPLLSPKVRLCHTHHKQGTYVRYNLSQRMQSLLWREHAIHGEAADFFSIRKEVNWEMLGDWDDWLQAWLDQMIDPHNPLADLDSGAQVDHYLRLWLMDTGRDVGSSLSLLASDLQIFIDALHAAGHSDLLVDLL